MNRVEIKNLQAVAVRDIPMVSPDELRDELIVGMQAGNRLVQYFSVDNPEGTVLYAVLADDTHSKLHVTSSVFSPGREWRSITPDFPSAQLFEREIFEECGLKPEGHPWLKPVRKGIAGIDTNETAYEFFAMTGDETHEVGVGPVHAGIIEPGHFRFSCHGEMVHHLEIELGFQHRGVEQLFVQNRNRRGYLLQLAESIAGDSVIAHAGAFARAYEALANEPVSRRVKLIRTIALELERIAVHLGDLAALSGDVAYLTGLSVFGALRTKVINTTMAICGNRFGRGLVALGGVRFDISDELCSTILATIGELDEEIETAAEVLFSSASVLERFEKTGIVDTETARNIGMVGPAARASGVEMDVRADHPFGAYEFFPVHTITLPMGDVFARAYIRYIEIQQSIRIVTEQLNHLVDGELLHTISSLQADTFVISLAEGWRGEVAHAAITDANGELKRVKIKDPSFHNWLGLALAVRGNGISDFPLCNKSFNLSYCGFDL